MILIKGKEIGFIAAGKKSIGYVYKGFILVYQSVRSCFGSGRWISSKPWLGQEKWKSNN